MKSRKTRMFVALGLLAISGFSLVAISFADEYKDIRLDANNAIQTIPTVIFKPSLDDDNSVRLKNVEGKRLVQIVTNTNNFVLSKGDSSANEGSNSTILGGNDNHVDNSHYSTIIAGESNTISNVSYGVIGGGKGNIVEGSYGTVAGGEGNKAKSYGVAVGGKLNAAIGSNSVAIGYNAKANGNNSVAMGKNATVDGNNSFLWSDGTLGDNTLASNDTFAVVGASGMVVNETKAHRFAKLTIGGSLIVRENKAVACGSETIGVLKVLNRTDATDHVCFCSCDGTKWNSLFVGGACSAKCDNTFVGPQCDPDGVTKNCEGDTISYSGGCLIGNLVEGNGAFLIDNNGKLHWTCQTENGSQIQCSGNIPTKDCNDPKGHGVCTGEPENAIFVESTDIKNKPLEYDNLGPTLYNKLSDVPANAKCAWYCSGGYYMEPGFTYCHKNRPCDPQEYEGYSVPYLEDTQERDVSKPGAAVLYGTRTCTNTVVCNNKELSLKGADVCPITCNDGFDYDEASGRCYQNGVCGDEHYTCDKGTLGTTSYSESTHSWTWTCLGINGGSDDLTCSEAEAIAGVCGSEYRTCSKGDVVSATEDESRWLWTCKGYNEGADKPCTKNKPCVERTCPSGVYTLSSCPWGDDYCTSCTPVDARCNNGTTVYSLDSCPCGYYKNGDSCVACGAKKYSSAGSSSCQTASVGYYANSSCSQTACTNKPDNAHYTSNASTNSCSWECNDGYSKSGNTCVADPVSCNCGYYNNNGTCTLCGAKKYSSAGASSCSTASVGYYANSSCSQTACTNKPSNSHYTSNASTDSCSWECDDGYSKSGNTCVADPVSCNCGYYNNNGTCTLCGAKKYSSAGASSCSTASVGYYANSSCSQTACTNKPDNAHYTSNASTNSCSWECDSGYHQSGTSCVKDDEPLSCDCSYYNYNGTCKACATGKYSAAGATSCSSCTNKPSNSSYTSNACTNSCSWQCNCGYYKNGSSCSACAVGKYSSAGATSCSNCTNKPSNSHYTSNACGNSCDWECDDGYTKAGTSCVKDDEPLSCDCSYYNDNGICRACVIGKYSVAGSTSCSSCTNKPSNSSYTSNACTNSCSWQCDCGYYKNGSSCTACGAKKYSSAGSTSCSTADVGYYANSSCSQTACTNKPSNSYYTSNASTNSCDWACNCGYYKNGSSCSSCGVGTYSSAGSTSCTNCSNKPSNSHYTSNACSNSCSWECDTGYHRSGNSCVQDSCDCGYYNNNGTCVACGAKKYSSAGASSCNTADVGYYANSSCSQTACTNKPEHSHYTSNASSNSCSWECDTDYKLNSAGNGCVKKQDIACGGVKYTCTSAGSYTVNEKPSTSTHYVWDCIGEDASAYDCKAEIPVSYSCQGTRPSHSIPSTQTVTSNKNWTYDSNLSSYCTYKCEDGYKLNYNGQYYSCDPAALCEDNVDGCQNGSTQTTVSSTNGLKTFKCTLGSQSETCHYCISSSAIYLGGSYCTDLCKDNESSCIDGATKTTTNYNGSVWTYKCTYKDKEKSCHYCSDSNKIYYNGSCKTVDEICGTKPDYTHYGGYNIDSPILGSSPNYYVNAGYCNCNSTTNYTWKCGKQYGSLSCYSYSNNTSAIPPSGGITYSNVGGVYDKGTCEQSVYDYFKSFDNKCSDQTRGVTACIKEIGYGGVPANTSCSIWYGCQTSSGSPTSVVCNGGRIEVNCTKG